MTIYYVKTDGNDGNTGLSWDAAWLSLNKVFLSAQDGDTVYVRDGTYTGVNNRGRICNGREITLVSESGPTNCILDAEGANRHLIMHSAEKTLEIDGFTFKNGYISNEGGSIYMSGSSGDNPTPTFKNCIWKNCYVDGTTNFGGAIYAAFSGPTLINCVFDSCYSAVSHGGAIFYSHGDQQGPTILTLTNCTMYNCSSGGNGGAIYATDDNVTLNNCIFNSCSAAGDGDEFYTAFGSIISLNYSCYDDTAGYYADSGFGGGSISIDGNCITDAPLLDSDLSLLSTSPCRDVGNNAYNSETYDVIGNDRIV